MQFDDKLSSHLKRVASKRKKDKKQAAKVKLLQKHNFRMGFNSGPVIPDDSDDDDGDGDGKGVMYDDDVALNEAATNYPRCTSKDSRELMCELLCMHAFYKQDFFWQVDFEWGEWEVYTGLQVTLTQLVTTLPQLTGEGWKIQKLHEVFFHLARQIRMYGQPNNTLESVV